MHQRKIKVGSYCGKASTDKQDSCRLIIRIEHFPSGDHVYYIKDGEGSSRICTLDSFARWAKREGTL